MLIASRLGAIDAVNLEPRVGGRFPKSAQRVGAKVVADYRALRRALLARVSAPQKHLGEVRAGSLAMPRAADEEGALIGTVNAVLRVAHLRLTAAPAGAFMNRLSLPPASSRPCRGL